MLGGESMFTNEFVAEDGQGTVTLAPPTPGDIMSHKLQDETLYSTDGAFIAGTEDIDIDSEVGGLKSTLLNGEGLVFEFTGPGTAWYQTRDMDSLVEILAQRMPSEDADITIGE